METEVTATSIALARQSLDMAASVLYVRAARAVGEWPRAGTPPHIPRYAARRPGLRPPCEDSCRKHRILKLGAASSCRKREAAPPRFHGVSSVRFRLARCNVLDTDVTGSTNCGPPR